MTTEKEFSYKYLLIFSLPSIVSSFLEPMASIVDSALVGNLNTTWLASLALAATLFNSFTWIFNFFLHIPTQKLSFYGAKGDQKKVGELIKVAVTLALVMGIAFSIILYILRFQLYDLIGATSDTVGQLDQYFSIRIFGHAIVLIYLVSLSSLRGLSKVNESFFIVLISTTINIILSYILLYHLDMGIKGAAWGTVIANTIGLCISFYFILLDKKRRQSILDFSWPRDVAMNFGVNSLNLFLRTMSLTICFFLATRISSSMGIYSLAAHQVALNFWLFSSYFIDGMAITANIKTAQLWSKNKVDMISILTKRLVLISGLLGLGFTILYGFFGTYLWSIFTNDTNVISIIDKIWPWIVYGQVFTSIAYLYDGVLFGTSDFKYLRTHLIIGAIFVFIPLAYVGYINQSLHGVWAGLTALALYRLGTSLMRVKSYGK